jgi:hypothetical protein
MQGAAKNPAETVAPEGPIAFWKRALGAILGSIILNLIILQLIVAAIRPSPEFVHFENLRVAFLTGLGALAAVGTYAIVRRRAKNPVMTFEYIATTALLLSFLPDLMLYIGQVPGVSAAAILGLMVLHVTAFLAVMTALVWIPDPQGP